MAAISSGVGSVGSTGGNEVCTCTRERVHVRYLVLPCSVVLITPSGSLELSVQYGVQYNTVRTRAHTAAVGRFRLAAPLSAALPIVMLDHGRENDGVKHTEPETTHRW
jgi:hypothetical protein